jgi:hypothetical protein
MKARSAKFLARPRMFKDNGKVTGFRVAKVVEFTYSRNV